MRLGWSLVVDPSTAQAVVVDALRTLYGRFMADVETGADRHRIQQTYRTLSDLAGLPPLYAIEDETTERAP